MPRGGKPKTYPAEIVEAVRGLYAENRTQAEIAAVLGTTQKVIWRLMVRHGIETRVAAKRDQRGAKNSTWGFSSVTYAAYHKRVEVERGRPQKCEVCGYEGADRRYDWANLTGRYDRAEDYRRMCRSCHRKHDRWGNLMRAQQIAEKEMAGDQ